MGDLVNGVGVIGVIVAGTLGALWWAPAAPDARGPQKAAAAVPDPGATALVDARGQTVAVERYTRIVSLNPVADQILLQVVEPERLLAVTDWMIHTHPEGWRFGAVTPLQRSDDLEAILALKPDLILLSQFTDEGRVARLREEGMTVFDIGDMRGVATLLPNIRTLSALVDEPARGDQLYRAVQRDLEALAGRVPPAERPWALYISVFGDSFFGGTTGTSYDDLLGYGGVQDLAARHGYTEWPRYSPEQLLDMNPSLVITQEGMADVLCGHAQVGLIAACRDGGRVVEVSSAYLNDPGLGLVEAAEQVQVAVHGPQAEAP